MSQARGSHYLKFGAEYRYHVGIGIFPNLMNLNFYPDSYRQHVSVAQHCGQRRWHASFLLGFVDNNTVARGFPFQTQCVPFLGTFFHDDWKITRRMTLNLGIRHEWESGPYDDNDIYSRYLDLNAPNRAMQQNPPVIPADLLALSQPKFNGAWIFTDSKNRKPFVTQKDIFLPRIGAAIRVNDKTAVNVGFARYMVPLVTGNGTQRAPIRWQPATGARDSTRHPLRCRWSKAGRRRICPIRSRRLRILSSCRSARVSGSTPTSETPPIVRIRTTARRSTIASTSRSCGRSRSRSKWTPPGS